MSTEPNRTLTNRLIAGRYDVLEPLVGDGPLIVAYRARDRSLNRIVTLKTIVPAYAGRDDVRSFLREGLGRSISLAHAGIARVYDVGEEPAGDPGEGILYLVEEHVRGIDLKERIRRAAPFQLAAANETAISIAEALDYAQTRGVSHGDLRPRVVLIGSVVTQGAQGAAIQGVPGATADNQLKLTGFGIARAQAAAIADDASAQRLVAAYRAPESLRPNDVPTPTGDVYSLGVLLYELLTGALPGNTTGADGLQLPSAANPNVPPALDGIVRMATALRPEDRYAAAGEMLTDLRAVRDALRYGKPLTWTPAPRPVAPPILPAPTPSAVPLPATEATVPLTAIQLAPIPVRPSSARQVVPVPPAEPAVPEATVASRAIEDLNDPYRNSASGEVDGQEEAPVPEPADRRPSSTISSHAVVPTGNVHPAFASAGASVASSATPDSAGAYRKEEEARLAYGNRDDGNNGSYERGSNVGRYLTSLNLFLLALVIAAVAVLIWQAAAFFKPADDVVVPNLVGKTMTDAREIAQQEKFDLAIVDEKYRDNEPEGVIYQMDTMPGRHIREGKQVSIYVSKGPPMTTVPDVRTKTIDQARQILLENNLKLGDISRAYDSTVDSGLVSEQKPDAPESRPRGSKVDLVVSKGSEPIPSDNPTPEPSDTPTPRSTPSPDAPTPDPDQHVRTFNIKYPVPNDSAPHHVRIDVTDRDGTRTVYDDTRKAGDLVKQPIEAVGTQIHIRLFDNDKLRSELTK